MRFLPSLLTSSRAQIGAGILAIGTLALAQLVIILLHHWPSSVILWALYFEYSRRLDSVFRLLEAALAIGTVDFVLLVSAFAAVAVLAVRRRVRLLEAVFHHGALGCTILVLLDNLASGGIAGPLMARAGLELGTLAIVALFAILALALAAACWRIHLTYFQLVRGASA